MLSITPIDAPIRTSPVAMYAIAAVAADPKTR
jgi:hypothetical protein